MVTVFLLPCLVVVLVVDKFDVGVDEPDAACRAGQRRGVSVLIRP